MTLNVPDLSERFSLTLSGGTSGGLPKGVDALHRLHVLSRRIDLAPLVALRKLADLSCRGALGGIDHIDVLQGLKNLRSFTGYDIYGFSAEDFPGLADCPHLSAVAIHGLRASDAKILRRRLADARDAALGGESSCGGSSDDGVATRRSLQSCRGLTPERHSRCVPASDSCAAARLLANESISVTKVMAPDGRIIAG